MLPAAIERAFRPIVIRDDIFPDWATPLSMDLPSLPLRPETDRSACFVSTVTPMLISASWPVKNPMCTPPSGGARAAAAMRVQWTIQRAAAGAALRFSQASSLMRRENRPSARGRIQAQRHRLDTNYFVIFTSNSRLQTGFLHFTQIPRAAASGPAQTTAALPQKGQRMGRRSAPPFVALDESRIPLGFARIDVPFPLSKVGREGVALLHLPVVGQLAAFHAG